MSTPTGVAHPLRHLASPTVSTHHKGHPLDFHHPLSTPLQDNSLDYHHPISSPLKDNSLFHDLLIHSDRPKPEVDLSHPPSDQYHPPERFKVPKSPFVDPLGNHHLVSNLDSYGKSQSYSSTVTPFTSYSNLVDHESGEHVPGLHIIIPFWLLHTSQKWGGKEDWNNENKGLFTRSNIKVCDSYS